MALVLAESISFGTYSACYGSFVKVVSEPISLLEVPIGFAWVKIDNTEGTTWTLIDNRQ